MAALDFLKKPPTVNPNQYASPIGPQPKPASGYYADPANPWDVPSITAAKKQKQTQQPATPVTPTPTAKKATPYTPTPGKGKDEPAPTVKKKLRVLVQPQAQPPAVQARPGMFSPGGAQGQAEQNALNEELYQQRRAGMLNAGMMPPVEDQDREAWRAQQQQKSKSVAQREIDKWADAMSKPVINTAGSSLPPTTPPNLNNPYNRSMATAALPGIVQDVAGKQAQKEWKQAAMVGSLAATAASWLIPQGAKDTVQGIREYFDPKTYDPAAYQQAVQESAQSGAQQNWQGANSYQPLADQAPKPPAPPLTLQDIAGAVPPAAMGPRAPNVGERINQAYNDWLQQQTYGGVVADEAQWVKEATAFLPSEMSALLGGAMSLIEAYRYASLEVPLTRPIGDQFSKTYRAYVAQQYPNATLPPETLPAATMPLGMEQARGLNVSQAIGPFGRSLTDMFMMTTGLGTTDGAAVNAEGETYKPVVPGERSTYASQQAFKSMVDTWVGWQSFNQQLPAMVQAGQISQEHANYAFQNAQSGLLATQQTIKDFQAKAAIPQTEAALQARWQEALALRALIDSARVGGVNYGKYSPAQLQDFETKAIAIEAAVPLEYAAVQELKNRTNLDILQSHQDWRPELLTGVFLDPTNALDLIGGPLWMGVAGAWAARNLVKAGDVPGILTRAATQGNDLASMLRMSIRPTKNQLNAMGVPIVSQAPWYLKLFEKTTATQEHELANIASQLGSIVFKGADNVTDAANILQTWIDNPEQLLKGVTGLTGEYYTKLGTPPVFGPNVVAGAEAQKLLPLLKAGKEKFLKMVSLADPAVFNPGEFMAEFDRTVWNVAREISGSAALDDMPEGVVKVVARELPVTVPSPAVAVPSPAAVGSGPVVSPAAAAPGGPAAAASPGGVAPGAAAAPSPQPAVSSAAATPSTDPKVIAVGDWVYMPGSASNKAMPVPVTAIDPVTGKLTVELRNGNPGTIYPVKVTKAASAPTPQAAIWRQPGKGDQAVMVTGIAKTERKVPYLYIEGQRLQIPAAQVFDAAGNPFTYVPPPRVTAIPAPSAATAPTVPFVGSGRYVVDYVDKDGNIIMSSLTMDSAQAAAHVKAVNDAAKAFAKNPVLKVLQYSAGIQRAFLSDMWLNLRPGHWVRNAAAAMAATMGDNLYTLDSLTDEILPYLGTKFFAGAGTGRVFEGLNPALARSEAEHWARRLTKGHKILDKANVYAAANEIGSKIWTGMTEILGTIPIGEQSFYVRAYYKGLGRAFSAGWEDVVYNQFGPVLKAIGVPQELQRNLIDRIVSAGIYGSKADVAQAARQIIYAATIGDNLATLGIPHELLTMDGWKALQQVLDDAAANKTNYPDGLQGVQRRVQDIKRIIAGERVRFQNIMIEAAPQVGAEEWTRAGALSEAAGIVDNLTAIAAAAGVPETEARPIAVALAAKTTGKELENWEAFVKEIATNSDDGQLNVAFDLMARVNKLKADARAEVDKWSRAAVDAPPDLQDPAWTLKWTESQKIYDKLSVDTQQAFADAVDDVRKVLAGETPAHRYDWWDAIERYASYDNAEFDAARAIDLKAATGPKASPRADWERVIEANRKYFDASVLRVYDAFRRFPDLDSFDLMRATQSNVDRIGQETSARIAKERNRIRALDPKAGTKEWNAYFAFRKREWDSLFDQQVAFNEGAVQAIVTRGLGKDTPSQLTWTEEFGGALDPTTGQWLPVTNTLMGRSPSGRWYVSSLLPGPDQTPTMTEFDDPAVTLDRLRALLSEWQMADPQSRAQSVLPPLDQQVAADVTGMLDRAAAGQDVTFGIPPARLAAAQAAYIDLQNQAKPGGFVVPQNVIDDFYTAADNMPARVRQTLAELNQARALVAPERTLPEFLTLVAGPDPAQQAAVKATQEWQDLETVTARLAYYDLLTPVAPDFPAVVDGKVATVTGPTLATRTVGTDFPMVEGGKVVALPEAPKFPPRAAPDVGEPLPPGPPDTGPVPPVTPVEPPIAPSSPDVPDVAPAGGTTPPVDSVGVIEAPPVTPEEAQRQFVEQYNKERAAKTAAAAPILARFNNGEIDAVELADALTAVASPAPVVDVAPQDVVPVVDDLAERRAALEAEAQELRNAVFNMEPPDYPVTAVDDPAVAEFAANLAAAPTPGRESAIPGMTAAQAAKALGLTALEFDALPLAEREARLAALNAAPLQVGDYVFTPGAKMPSPVVAIDPVTGEVTVKRVSGKPKTFKPNKITRAPARAVSEVTAPVVDIPPAAEPEFTIYGDIPVAPVNPNQAQIEDLNRKVSDLDRAIDAIQRKAERGYTAGARPPAINADIARTDAQRMTRLEAERDALTQQRATLMESPPAAVPPVVDAVEELRAAQAESAARAADLQTVIANTELPDAKAEAARLLAEEEAHAAVLAERARDVEVTLQPTIPAPQLNGEILPPVTVSTTPKQVIVTFATQADEATAARLKAGYFTRKGNTWTATKNKSATKLADDLVGELNGAPVVQAVTEVPISAAAAPVTPAVSGVTEGAPTQPLWAMTPQEIAAQGYLMVDPQGAVVLNTTRGPDPTGEAARSLHERLVLDALNRGDPVPENVLALYPRAVNQAPPPTLRAAAQALADDTTLADAARATQEAELGRAALKVQAFEEDVVTNGKRPIPIRTPVTAESFKQQMQDAYLLDDTQAAAVDALAKARAKVWARQTGRDAQEWYGAHFAGIEYGGVPGPDALAQKLNLDTPEFHAWFDGSKVVDESGAPKVMYHGSPTGDIEAFDPAKVNQDALWGPGYYFTENPNVAAGQINESTSSLTYHDTKEAADAQPNRNWFSYRDDATGKWIAQVKSPSVQRKGYAWYDRSVPDPLMRTGKVYPEAERGELARRLRATNTYDYLRTRGLSDGERARMEDYLTKIETIGDVLAAQFVSEQPYNLPVKEIAMSMGLQGPGSTYPVHLSIRNPIDMDRALTAAEANALLDKAAQWQWSPSTGIYNRNAVEEARTVLLRDFAQARNVTNGSVYRELDYQLNSSGRARPELTEFLKSLGYDGITHIGGTNTGTDPHRVYIAFDPAQVKSIFNPRPTADPRLLYQNPQVQTPNFRAWFGDSKAVDEETGQAKVFYHGTGRAPWEEMKLSEISNGNWFGKGLYVAEDPELAARYSGLPGPDSIEAVMWIKNPQTRLASADTYARWGGGQGVMPLYVKAESPFAVDMSPTPREMQRLHDAIDRMERASSGVLAYDNNRQVRNLFDLYREDLNQVNKDNRDLFDLFRNPLHDESERPNVWAEIIRGAGYDSIVYNANLERTWEPTRGGMERVFVIFDPTQIKSAIANTGEYGLTNPSILRQANPAAAAKGSAEFMGDGRVILRGLNSPDVSTAVHELGHVFRKDLADVAKAGDAQAAADMVTLEKWANVVNGDWTVDAEEQFARGFERYLQDGQAPTPELQSVFQRFKAWLAEIYRALKEKVAPELSPEMRGVYDRLLADVDVTPVTKTVPSYTFPVTQPTSKWYIEDWIARLNKTGWNKDTKERLSNIPASHILGRPSGKTYEQYLADEGYNDFHAWIKRILAEGPTAELVGAENLPLIQAATAKSAISDAEYTLLRKRSILTNAEDKIKSAYVKAKEKISIQNNLPRIREEVAQAEQELARLQAAVAPSAMVAPPITAMEDIFRPEPTVTVAPATPSTSPWHAATIDDIRQEDAARAFYWSSTDPDRRGRSWREGYVDHMNRVADEYAPYADTPEKAAMLRDELERYRTRYLAYSKELLGKESRTASTMITGPANFNVRRNDKAMASLDRTYNEMQEWSKKAQQAIDNKMRPELAPITGTGPDALARLQAKLADTQALQQHMKDVNAVIRKKLPDAEKVKQLKALGLDDEEIERTLVKGNVFGDKGYASFELTNNNAEIRRLEERVKAIGALATRRAETAEWTFDGGRVVDNVEEDRVQIIFDAKLSEEDYEKMRKAGFVYSRKNKAFQRGRMNARWAVHDRTGIDINKPPVAAAAVVAEEAPAARTIPLPEMPVDVAEVAPAYIPPTPGPQGAPVVTAVTATPNAKPRLVGYEWRRTEGERYSAYEGGLVKGRISDWDNTEVSAGSGRDIVHVYWIQEPDGTIKPYGKVTAAERLGMPQSRVDQQAQKYINEVAKQQERYNFIIGEVAEIKGQESIGDARANMFERNRYGEMNDVAKRVQEANIWTKDGKYYVKADDPDYNRAFLAAGWERTEPPKPETIAPVVTSAPSAPPLPAARRGLVGSTVKGWSDPARQYDFEYEIVKLDDLIPSNLADGRINPRYPAELQPRDRTQQAAQMQVTRMAGALSPDELLTPTNAIDRGAPIIGPDNVVESGNGRVLAMRKAPYETYGKYMDALLNRIRGKGKEFGKESYGITPAALDAWDNIYERTRYVLVRRRVSDVDRVQFAQEANARVTLGMNQMEAGKTLANNLQAADLSTLYPAQSGKLDDAFLLRENRDAVRNILQKIPRNEQAAYLTADGQLNPEGAKAIRAALFTIVFPDNQRILRNYVDTLDTEMRNIGNGLERSIIDLAKVQLQNPDLGIGNEIAEAIDLVAQARSKGYTVAGYFDTPSLFGMPMQLRPLAEALDANIRSGKAIGQIFTNYTTEAIQHVPGQASLLDDTLRPDKFGLLNAAIAQLTPADSGQQTLWQMPTPSPLPAAQQHARTWADNLQRMWGKGKDPEVGNVALHQLNTLDEAEAKLIQAVTNPARLPNNLTPLQRNQAIQYLDGKLLPQFDDTLLAASKQAESMANGAMLNYQDRRNFDTILSLVFPFHYFWTRGGLSWVQRMARKPSLLNMYYELERAVGNENAQSNVPERLKGTIFAYRDKTGAYRFMNPMQYVMPFQRWSGWQTNTDTQGSELARTWQQFTDMTPGANVGYAIGMAALLDQTDPKPEGEPSRFSEATRAQNFSPIVKVGADAYQAVTGQIPQFGSDSYDVGRVRRSLAEMGQEGAFDANRVQYAQQLATNLAGGADRFLNIPAADRANAEKDYAAAAKRAGVENLLSSAGGLLAGTPAYRLPDSELALTQQSQDWRDLGAEPGTGMAFAQTGKPGSAEARQNFMEQNPMLGPWWGRWDNAAQPGIEAQQGAYWDGLDAIYKERQAAVDAAIQKGIPKGDVYDIKDSFDPKLDAFKAAAVTQAWAAANPNATPAEIAAHQAKLLERQENGDDLALEINAALGIKPSTSPPSGANLRERALWTLENQLWVDGRPEWPGDKSSKSAQSKYYDEYDKWKVVRAATITARLDGLRKVLSTNPSADLVELFRLIDGMTPEQIVLEFATLKNVSEIEKAWARESFVKGSGGGGYSRSGWKSYYKKRYYSRRRRYGGYGGSNYSSWGGGYGGGSGKTPWIPEVDPRYFDKGLWLTQSELRRWQPANYGEGAERWKPAKYWT